MFPLNAVLFPGVSMPLTVFEDRYRALVHHLLRLDPDERYFGSVGIREGYEVGEHGSQSLFRIGCRVQLTEVDPRPAGAFSVAPGRRGPPPPPGGSPRIRRTPPGRGPPALPCRSTSGRHCSRPRTPPTGSGWSPT